jgi:hypothetical protein
MSLITIARAIADEIGHPAPSALVGSTDLLAKRMLAAAKGAGEELYRAHRWSILGREYVFDTVDGVDNYAVPDDWGRPVGDSAWDRDTFWRMKGSMSPGEWQFRRSGLVATPALRRRFRLMVGPLAGSILLDPMPTATGATLVIEYTSRHWCEGSDGTGKATLTADTDEIRLDHEVFRLTLLWRVKRSNGLAYADERLDHDRALRDAIKQDLALPIVNAIGRKWEPMANLPDGNFGL